MQSYLQRRLSIFFILLWLFVILATLIKLYEKPRKLNEMDRDILANYMKYILLWKGNRDNKLILNITRHMDCPFSNCIFTDDEFFFHGNYTDFDVVVFDQSMLTNSDRPETRLASQLYVFFSLESAPSYPACEVYNDNYFNWTMTSRLDSVIPFPYILVKDRNGTVVAPSRKTVIWKDTEEPISNDLKTILASKTKAAAWLVSNCFHLSPRNEYLAALQEEMYLLGIKLDLYGFCPDKLCTYNNNCSEMIKRDYYFYMAFENSFAEDYLTENVLHGYDNYAVPIVFGGADYERFLPPGSYINALEMHPHALAYIMKQAIDDPDIYHNYFTWRNLYTVTDRLKETSVNQPLCNFCAALNMDRAKNSPALKKFRSWWNGRDHMKWCVPDAMTWEIEYWTLNATFGHLINYNTQVFL